MSSITDLAPGTWNLDPAHSEIGFSVRHLMISKIRGAFTDVVATATVGDPATSSTLDFTVQATSITTNNADRDAHLRSGDFFDVEAYPTIAFRSTAITDETVTGDLTIKGVTKPVTFTYEFGGIGQDPWGGVRAGFTATGEIDRTEFGVTFNAPLDGGGVLVGEKIALSLDLEFVQAN